MHLRSKVPYGSLVRMSETHSTEARVWELGFLLAPTLPEADAVAEGLAIKTLVVDCGLSPLAEEAPRSIALAYPIARTGAHKKTYHTSAYFGWVKFEGQAECLETLAQEMKKRESVLRHILISTVRESTTSPRKLFTSDELAGKTIEKKVVAESGKGKLSEEELDKTIDALVQ